MQLQKVIFKDLVTTLSLRLRNEIGVSTFNSLTPLYKCMYWIFHSVYMYLPRYILERTWINSEARMSVVWACAALPDWGCSIWHIPVFGHLIHAYKYMYIVSWNPKPKWTVNNIKFPSVDTVWYFSFGRKVYNLRVALRQCEAVSIMFLERPN